MDDYVTRLSARWIPSILRGDGVAIPDDPGEMNWRCFFAHSQDMQGFAAGIFTGGRNEDRHPSDPAFRRLRERWPDSRSMIEGLAAVWDDPAAQAELRRWSHPFRPAAEKALGITPVVELLAGPQGNDATRVFVQTLMKSTRRPRLRAQARREHRPSPDESAHAIRSTRMAPGSRAARRGLD